MVSFIVCILGAQTQVLMLANQALSQLRYHPPPISLISNSRKYNVWIIYLHLSKLPGLSLKLSFSSSRLAANLHEVSASKSSLLGQELSAGKDSFMLEDHGGDRLVYMANQKLKPETLVSHYENDQGSAAMASLTSGKNMDR